MMKLLQLLLWAAWLHFSLTEGNTEVCRNAEAFTLMPHELDCHKFYVCTGLEDGSAQEYTCAAGYHYSRLQQRCVHGVCEEQRCNASLPNVQRLAHDCTSYKHCTSRGSYQYVSCGRHRYFDVGHQACLPIEATPAHQCSCIMPEHTVLANQQDCRSYYRCEQGRAALKICPVGYYYNSSISGCLLDVNNVCPSKDSADNFVSVELAECNKVGSRVVPHSTDCSRYFACVSTAAIELSCPSGQYFDVLQRSCTQDEGQCQKRLMPPTSVKVEPQTQPHQAPKEKITEQTTPELVYNKLSSKFVLN